MKQDNTLAIVLVVILVLFLFGASAGFGMMGCGRMMGSYEGLGFTWIFMSLIWILVIIALVLGILWLAKQLEKDRKKKK